MRIYTPENPLRIAMWSPPRARSTMMMRVFEAMGCAVFDEPFYPYWLRETDRQIDPGFRETVTRHETDWRKIIELVLASPPVPSAFYYQKHMAIHMLDEVDLGWMSRMLNCFLIRHPAEVINSMKKHRVITPELVGIPQLVRIYDRAREIHGKTPLIIDANDVLENPEGVLGKFCAAAGMPEPKWPLTWAAGRHPYDGAWAEAWYAEVFETTGLRPYVRKEPVVEAAHQAVLEECLPVYRRLFELRITA